MTESDFRDNAGMRCDLAAILGHPSFEQAVSIIKRKMAGVDAKAGSHAIESVRLLSQRSGYDLMLLELENLTQPNPPTPADELATYGADEAARKLSEQTWGSHLLTTDQ